MKMTVKELKELLANVNDDREILVTVNEKEFNIDSVRKTKSTNELIIEIQK